MSLEHRIDSNDNETVEQEESAFQTDSSAPFYSFVLIGCYLAVFAFQFLTDNQDKSLILDLGADNLYEYEKSWAFLGLVKKLFADGQYWRILTAGVAHAGIMHLFFNSYATYVFGSQFEILTNGKHLIIVFLLAVAGGGIFSQLFLPTGVSLGASGGVLGLLGYLAVYAFKRRKLLSADFTKAIFTNIVLVTFFGVVVIQNTDNWAHLGGFLTGAVYALFQVPNDLYKDPRTISKITEISGNVAVLLLFLVCLFAILVMVELIKIPLPVVTPNG